MVWLLTEADASYSTLGSRLKGSLAHTCSRREGGPLNCAPSADAVAGNGPPLMRRPSADAVAGNGGPLNCAPSADAVAGNGRPLSYSLRSPSADAVAGGGQEQDYSPLCCKSLDTRAVHPV